MKHARPVLHSRDHLPLGADPLGTRWFFVNPVAPADVDGPVFDDDPAALFEEPWTNIEGYEPTAFRIAENGHIGLRIVATGDEDTEGSLIFNLPVGYRPAFVQRRFGVVGGGTAGIIEARTNGDVVFIGLVEAP